MARPAKPEGERLVPMTTSISAARFDYFDRIARERRVPLATVLRECLDPTFRERKTTELTN